MNTPHPGESLREDVLVPLKLGVGQAAKMLGISRAALSRVINCRAAISPDLAIRLEMAGISTAQVWTAWQSRYDLEQARKNPHEGVKRFPQAPANDDGSLAALN